MSSPSVVLHIPHSSTIIPADVRADLLLTDEELEAELLAMTDLYTDELFRMQSGSARIVYPVSRLVVDPERFVDDAKESMAPFGMGVIYTRTSIGTTLREPPTEATRAGLLGRFYEPHHRLVAEAVDASLGAHGRCLIIDCHSFRSVPLPHEPDQSVARPDICVGTDPQHTPASLTTLALTLFKNAGFTAEQNRLFAGTIVPEAHYGEATDAHSIMLELNRALYMDESSGRRLSCFGEIAAVVRQILEQIAAQAA